MAIDDEQFQRGQAPVGLVTADGFPWPRLVIGTVAVAISMALGWRAEQPIEPTGAPAPQAAMVAAAAATADGRPAAAAHVVEQPVADVAAAAAPDTSPPPVPMLVAQAPEPVPSDLPQRHQLQRRAGRAKASSDVTASRQAPRANSRSAGPSQVAPAKSARSRAEVRNEYIAERAQVAALTGEDSGSDYLARMAARRHLARTVLAGQAHHKSQAGRRAPAPS